MALFIFSKNPTTGNELLRGSYNIPVAGDMVAAEQARVVSLQADGDELDAIIWGLRNYRKTP